VLPLPLPLQWQWRFVLLLLITAAAEHRAPWVITIVSTIIALATILILTMLADHDSDDNDAPQPPAVPAVPAVLDQTGVLQQQLQLRISMHPHPQGGAVMTMGMAIRYQPRRFYCVMKQEREQEQSGPSRLYTKRWLYLPQPLSLL
jgi:hypothetical protein